MEPLALAALAGLTPCEDDVRFVDDRSEAIPYDDPTDMVAISVETYTAKRAYRIAGRFRERDVPVVLGGFHPTLVPEEASRHADAIVVGQAEELWPVVVADCRADRLRKMYRAQRDPSLADRTLRRDIFDGRDYLPIVLIESGRGCRFACNFCSVSSFFRRTYNARPVQDVVTEIESRGVRTAFLVDDNIAADVRRARELFVGLAPLGVEWIGQASLNVASDANMVALMRRSGCRGLLIGLESLNQESLALMGKSCNGVAGRYDEALKRLRDNGIVVYATFVFGYDTDRPDCIARTLEFALRQKFFLAAFNHLVPFPGTPVYRELEKQGRLLVERWWLEDGFRFGDVAFRPRHMAAEELAARCFQARSDFYRFGSVLKRGMEWKSNCCDLRMFARYFGNNFFSRREVRRRQWLPLGEGLE